MKIGVITFWTSSSNYGQILQGYALQTYLKSLGHDAFIIRFNSILSRIKEILLIIQKGQLLTLIKQNKKRNFNSFKKNISYSDIQYHTYNKLLKVPPKVDLLITGSDQVWAYMRNKERRNAYLLNFNNGVKKIAYAASFGRDHLKEDEILNYQKAFNNFEFIGVREKSGLNICYNLGFTKARQVIDPVALIPDYIWVKLEKNPKLLKNEKKNIFIYSLSNDTLDPALKRFLTTLREKYNVYYTNSSNEKSTANCFPTINEWIGYINHCDFIITDSFHCTLMSIILNKQFVTITRQNGKDMNNRLLTLFEITGINGRYLSVSQESEILELIENVPQLNYSIEFKNLIEQSKLLLNNILQQQ